MAQEFSLSIVFKAIDRLTAPMRRMGNSFRRQTRTIQRLMVSLRKLGRAAIRTGKRLSDVGKNLALKLTTPIVLFGRRALLTARDFEAAMNFVQAVTNATEDEFIALQKTARDLGKTTQFSAIQSAEAMKFLGLAGLNVNQIIGAMPKVLELAASAQLDLGSASDIVTNIMFGLGKQTNDLAEVNDVLVNAFTKAKVDLPSLGQAFRKAGTTLKTAGVDFKTTTALLQGLGQVGDIGGVAGRGLNRMVVELGKLRNASRKEFRILRRIGIRPKQLFDINGQLIDMVDIIRLFGKSKIDLISATELLGRLGGPTLLKLMESGADQLEKNRRGLDEIGIASRVAKSQMRGLPGVIKRLVSVWEALNIALVKSGFDELFNKFTTSLSNFIEKLAETNPKILNFFAIFLTLLSILGPFLIALGLLIKAIGFISIGFGKLLGVLKLITPLFASLLGILKFFTLGHPIIAFVLALAAGALFLLREWKPVEIFFEKLGQLWEKLGDLWKKLDFKSVFSKLIPQEISDFFNSDIKPMQNRRLNNAINNKQDKSLAEVNIRVSSDKGSSAVIEKVKKTGFTKIDVNNAGFIGVLP